MKPHFTEERLNELKGFVKAGGVILRGALLDEWGKADRVEKDIQDTLALIDQCIELAKTAKCWWCDEPLEIIHRTISGKYIPRNQPNINFCPACGRKHDESIREL